MDDWIERGLFGWRVDVYARGNQRVLAGKGSREVICRYEVEDSSGQERRNTESR